MDDPAALLVLDHVPGAWDILFEWIWISGKRTSLPESGGAEWIRGRCRSVLAGEGDGQSLAVVDDLSFYALYRVEELTGGDAARTRCICFVYRVWLEKQCREIVRCESMLGEPELFRRMGEKVCTLLTPEELGDLRRMLYDQRAKATNTSAHAAMDVVDLLVTLMAARGISERLRDQFTSGSVQHDEHSPGWDWQGAAYSLNAAHTLCGAAIKATPWLK